MGVWARARLAEAGYILDAGCPKCGQRDDLHHMLWTCEGEDVKQARERALANAEVGIVGRAVAATPGSTAYALYTRG
jgi:hypothetical protein